MDRRGGADRAVGRDGASARGRSADRGARGDASADGRVGIGRAARRGGSVDRGGGEDRGQRRESRGQGTATLTTRTSAGRTGGGRGRGKQVGASRGRGGAPRSKESFAPSGLATVVRGSGERWNGESTPRASNHIANERASAGREERTGREEGERLQKVLSRAGLASRREVEDWIRAGRISVNGELAVLGVRVGPTDHVRLDGRLIRQRAVGGSARVFLIHRSPGENLQQLNETPDQLVSDESPDFSEGVESVGETRESSTPSAGTPLLDRIPRRAGRRFIPVSPMPRVDGGLELVTSDGDLASKLQRSMRRLSSEFSVRVHGELSAQGLETISQGMLDTGEKLDIRRCEAAGGEGSNRWYSLVTRGASGKDVRQLFERQGALVSRVLRTQLGSLALDRHLSRGRFRELSAEELQTLLATAEGDVD
jgi:23S rRNA pseudouridine2605 synthase